VRGLRASRAQWTVAPDDAETPAIPELMDMPGICSAELMADRATGRGIVITAWEDAAAMAAARAAAARLRADVSAVTHAQIRSVEEYRLEFSSVREGDTRSLIERNIELWNARDREGWLAAAHPHPPDVP